MDFFSYAILGALGLLIGSFLNVIILRFDTGLSISQGRSACFSCGKTLRWYELVPLASFIFLRGRCRGCKATISWQYPLVETVAAAAFVLAYVKTASVGIAPFVLLASILCLYIVIFVYDLRHKIIPDVFSYGAAVVALVMAVHNWQMTGMFPLSHLLAGIALFLFYFSFWYFSKGRWMGLGDGKLALSIGFFLGLSGGIAATLLAFWIGAAIMLLVMLLGRFFGHEGRLGLKSEIPFGPFMIIGFLIVLVGQIDMRSLLSLLAL